MIKSVIKIQKKYEELPLSLKAAMWYTVCNIIQKSLSFLVTPIFTRIMSKEDYGLFTVYNSWYWIVVVFATLNLCNGIFNNGMQENKEKRDEYTSILQSVGSFATILCFIVYLPFNNIIEEKLGLSFFLCILMFIEAFFTPALYFWQARQRYEYRYKKMAVVTLLIAVFRPLISAIAVIISSNKGLARVLSVVIFESLVGLCFYVYHIYKGKRVFDMAIWKSALFFAMPLIPHYLSQTFLAHLDKLMIDNFWGRDKVALYEIAYTIAMITTFINTSINNSFIPWLYDKLEKKQIKDVSLVSNALLLIVGTINIFIIFFAKEIVFILGGIEYRSSAFLVPTLAWSVYFMFLYNLFGDIEFFYKKTMYTMIGSLFACILNAVMNYFFIPLFGYQAAAYTTLISYMALAWFHYFFVRIIERQNNITQVFNYRMIFLISCLGTGISLFAQILYNYNGIRYIIITVFLFLAIIFRKKYLGYILSIKNNIG